MLVRSADPADRCFCDRRTDGQTDRRIKGVLGFLQAVPPEKRKISVADHKIKNMTN